MSKGVFGTPRTLGKVAEIVVLSAQIRRLDGLGINDTYEIYSNMGEGEEQEDGAFLSKTQETFSLKVEEFSISEKTIVRNFLKLLIRKYAKYKNYSDLTVS